VHDIRAIVRLQNVAFCIENITILKVIPYMYVIFDFVIVLADLLKPPHHTVYSNNSINYIMNVIWADTYRVQ
jgi:hypothetical protein